MNINWYTDFESSNLAAFGHAEGHLYVRFKNGGVYRYLNVPLETYEALVISNSKGQFLAANIKNHFEFEKLDAALVR